MSTRYRQSVQNLAQEILGHQFVVTLCIFARKFKRVSASSQELFSSYQIGTGTRLLLKTVSELAGSRNVRKALDLGCGYGPPGLALAKVEPGRQVHLVHRDALVVEFTRANVQMNVDYRARSNKRGLRFSMQTVRGVPANWEKALRKQDC